MDLTRLFVVGEAIGDELQSDCFIVSSEA